MICCLGIQFGYSQNLVLNPSFETVNTGNLLCSWYINQGEFNSAIGSWTCPTGGSTDIFSTTLNTGCFCSTQSTNASGVGQQNPRTGNTHSAIYVYGTGGCTPYREYLQGRLCTSLVAGQTYQVEMYVSLADKSNKGASNIGVKFSNTAVNVGSMCVYNATPDLNYTGAVITDKVGWTLISFSYTPTVSGQQFFMIGNFFSDAATATSPALPGTENSVRYFVDDVSVTPVGATGNAGTNGTVDLCQTNTAVNLFNYLGGSPSNTGTWSGPSVLPGGYLGSFDPAVHATGVYTYSVSSAAVGCGVASSTQAQVVVTLTASNATITQPAPLCLNSAPIQLTASTAGGTWSATCGACITSSGMFNPAVAGVGSYAVTYNLTGICPASDTKNIVVNLLPIINTVNDTTICANTTATLTVTGANTYNWSPVTGLSSSTGATVNASPATTTTYTITGDLLGCTAQANITVSVNPSPILNIGPDQFICMNDSIPLTVSGTLNYNWSPSGSLTSSTGNAVVAFPATTTIYTVTGEDAFGCVGHAAVTVTVNPLPTVSAGNNVSICANTSTGLTASGAYAYVWSPALGLSSTSGSFVVASPTNTTIYMVEGTDSNGCKNTANVTVQINPLPVIDAGPNANICENESAQLAASGGVSYLWTPSQWLSDTLGANVISAPDSDITYTVFGMDVNGCIGSDQVSVFLFVPPTINLGADVAICEGSSIQLTATGADTYVWLPTTGVTATNPNNSIITTSPNTSISYQVTGTDVNGCVGNGEVTVAVRNNPQVAFDVFPSIGCAPLTVNFVYSGDPVSIYNWSFGNGTQQNIVSPSVIYNQPGSYSVTLTATDAFGCSATFTQTDLVNVYPYPQAGMSASPLQMWEDNAFATIVDGSNDANSWQYFISDGHFYSTPNFTHQFTDTGNYHIVQIVTSIVGCSDTASLDVFVSPVSSVYIPNAFTPGNNDYLNSTFKVYGNIINDFELYIFNRWGEKIFTSQDQNVGWDGTTQNGKLCKQDVYVYKVNYTDHRKEQKTISGSVSLVR